MPQRRWMTFIRWTRGSSPARPATVHDHFKAEVFGHIRWRTLILNDVMTSRSTACVRQEDLPRGMTTVRYFTSSQRIRWLTYPLEIPPQITLVIENIWELALSRTPGPVRLGEWRNLRGICRGGLHALFAFVSMFVAVATVWETGYETFRIGNGIGIVLLTV